MIDPIKRLRDELRGPKVPLRDAAIAGGCSVRTISRIKRSGSRYVPRHETVVRLEEWLRTRTGAARKRMGNNTDRVPAE